MIDRIIGIYKITNPKGKVYIGQSNNMNKRWSDYKKLRCKTQPHLYRSLQKYGVENHIFEILENCAEIDLDTREIYWGNLFDAKNVDIGLNIGEFGKVPPINNLEGFINRYGLEKGTTLFKEFSNKFKIRQIGHIPWNKGLTKERSHMFGRTVSEESRQKQKDSTIYTKFYQYSINLELIKIWEKEKDIYISGFNKINKTYKLDKIRFSRGFIWISEELHNTFTKDELLAAVEYRKINKRKGRIYKPKKIKKKKGETLRKPVLQYDSKGNFVKEWESIMDAARSLSVEFNRPIKSISVKISQVASNKRGKTSNYIWKYKENGYTKINN